MNHYFINKEHKKDDFFKFETYFYEKKYYINSCSDIFSKNIIDYGSRLLIETIIKKEKLFGDVLDFGCGYGIVGMVLADNFPNTNFLLCDINRTAVNLANQNLKENNILNATSVESDLFDGIEKNNFNFIISNPPIRVGKIFLKNFIWQSFIKLKTNGSLILVIKKKHGEESIKKFLEEKFSIVEILEREKGYYILKATKVVNL